MLLLFFKDVKVELDANGPKLNGILMRHAFNEYKRGGHSSYRKFIRRVICLNNAASKHEVA